MSAHLTTEDNIRGVPHGQCCSERCDIEGTFRWHGPPVRPFDTVGRREYIRHFFVFMTGSPDLPDDLTEGKERQLCAALAMKGTLSISTRVFEFELDRLIWNACFKNHLPEQRPLWPWTNDHPAMTRTEERSCVYRQWRDEHGLENLAAVSPAPTPLQPIATDEDRGSTELGMSMRFTWAKPVVSDQEYAQFVEDPRTNLIACYGHDQRCFVVKSNEPRGLDLAARRIKALRPHVTYDVHITEDPNKGLKFLTTYLMQRYPAKL